LADFAHNLPTYFSCLTEKEKINYAKSLVRSMESGLPQAILGLKGFESKIEIICNIKQLLENR